MNKVAAILAVVLLIANVAFYHQTKANARSLEGMKVFIDGEYIATSKGSIAYDGANKTITIETHQGVLGCTLDWLFHDRYEDQE